MSRASCCEVCDTTDPHWNITRRGDVVTTWACDDHLASACAGLQRDHEVTELIVVDARKGTEWAGIGRSLERIAQQPPELPCNGPGHFHGRDPFARPTPTGSPS